MARNRILPLFCPYKLADLSVARSHGVLRTFVGISPSSQLGQLLRELREERRSYFGHLTYHLAVALFFTGCRFHEWARLTFDRLVYEPGGVIIAARLQLKGGSFRDLPLTKELSDSLEEWFAFLESVKGVRLRGGGVDFADLRSSFLAVTALPLAIRPSTHASSLPASARGASHFRSSTAPYGRDSPCLTHKPLRSQGIFLVPRASHHSHNGCNADRDRQIVDRLDDLRRVAARSLCVVSHSMLVGTELGRWLEAELFVPNVSARVGNVAADAERDRSQHQCRDSQRQGGFRPLPFRAD
jgi:hypothetical protein